MHKKILKVLIIFIIFIAILILAISFLTWKIYFTSSGGEVIATQMVERLVDGTEMTVKSSSGNLKEGLIFKELEIEIQRGKRAPSILKIQELMIKIDGLNQEGITANIHNGRLFMPGADPVIFFGKIKNGNIDIDGSVTALNNRILSDNLPINLPSDLSFEIANVDIKIRGTISLFHVIAKLKLRSAEYKKFKASQSTIKIDGDIQKQSDGWQPLGNILISGGEIKGDKTATVKVERGKLRFNRIWNQPYIDLKGSSEIEKVHINIQVQGNYKDPKIVLNSEPSLPKEKLLLMLATNRGWAATERALKNGQIVSTDVAKDLINYFLFSGSENTLFKRLGIREIDVQVEKGKRGVSVIKDVTDSFSASYGVTQITNAEKPEEKTFQQKIGGEYKINENISAEFEKELYLETESGEPVRKPDDTFFLKFEKNF